MTIRRLGVAAVVLAALPALLAAQAQKLGSLSNRAPDKDASQLMITSFKVLDKSENNKKEKGLAYLAGEEMRKRVDDAFSPKLVWVIPVERLNQQLDASNFPTTEGLAIHDAKALGGIIRADEFIQGTAVKTATGVRVDADLVLTRDIAARQPLGFYEAPKLGDAIAGLVKELKDARKQLDGEKKCMSAARDQKWDVAIQFANAGIAAYPKSTLARACLLNVLYSSKAPIADVVKVAKELAAIDPRSTTALKFVAQGFREGGAEKSDSLVMTLLSWMQADPTNTQLQVDAIREIADAKNPGIARPIIDSAVVQNPGDSELLSLRWKILGAVKDYKAMREAGLELIGLDTAYADTTYYSTTANVYAIDSMFKEAAAAAAEGVKKFPTDAYLTGYEIQMLQKAGELPVALEKLNKAMASKVSVPNAGALKLVILQQMKAPSAQIVAVAKELIAAGDTTGNVRQIVLNELQALVVLGSGALVQTDAAAAIDSLNVALVSLKEAETSLAKTPLQKSQVAYLTGAANLQIAVIKSQQSAATKNCQLAKDARANVMAALISLPGGPAFAQAAVSQSFQRASQTDTYLGQLMSSFPNCK